MTGWTRLPAAASLALVCWTQPTLANAAACHADMLELPVKIVGSRAVATVGINGTSVPLTVDSGASFGFLTDAAVEQLQLPTRRSDRLRVSGITGKVDVKVTTVYKMKLLNGEIPKMEFVVGGNEPGAGTMGLMGRNMLSFTDTEYDLAHGMIRFFFPNDACANADMAYWAGDTPVTVVDLLADNQTRNPAIRAWVKLNGKEVPALFDTGATTVVTTSGARRAGVAETDLKPSGAVYGLGRGRARSWTAPFAKFELGGEAISNNTLRVADMELPDADVLLGIDFFLSHRIYISNAQSRMYLTYNGGPVFARDAESRSASATPVGGPEETATMTADQLSRRGAASAARSDYEGALADLNRACELEPSSAVFLAQRGAIQAAMKRPAKALEDLDKSLSIDTTQVDARVQRAGLRLAGKDRDGAKADLDILDRTLAPQAEMRRAMASLYLGLDLPAQALAQANQWLAAHPNEAWRASVLNSRCWSRARLGIELDKALDDCDDAIDSDADNAAYLDSRGWIHLRMRRYDKALADFDRAIASQPKQAFSLYGRGLTRTYLGNAAQGNDDFMAARKLQPDIDVRVTEAGLVPASTPKP